MRTLSWVGAALLGAAVVLGGSAMLLANAPPPPPRPAPATPKITAPVVVEHRELEPGTQAVLRIPARWAAELAGGGGAPGAKPASSAPPSAAPRAGNAPPREQRSALPYGGTLVAGLALSLAAVSLVFVLKRGPTTRLVAGLCLTLVIAALAATAVLADIRIPGQPYRGPARRPDEAPVPAERMVIEVTPEGEAITLILPAEKKPR